jgi:CopG family transcriptional regulator/antitoxin EndoAI
MSIKERQITTIWLPSRLARETKKIAEKEGRTKSEFIREAVRQYIWLIKWSRLREYGSMKAAELKLRPGNIDATVHALRKEARKSKNSR